MLTDYKNVRHYLEVLRSISRKAVIGKTPAKRLSELVKIVANELHWDVCSIYILDPAVKELILAATCGLTRQSVGKIRLPISKGVVGSALREEKPIFLENTANDHRFKYFPETGEEKYKSLAAVPFARDGQLSGVLTVQTIQPYQFSTADMHFLEILANQIGQAVDVALSLKKIGRHKELVLVGTPAASGVIEARIHLTTSSNDRVEILARGFRGAEFEKKLFDNAVGLALQEIDNLIKQMDGSSTPAAQIFTAHKMMLQDPDFNQKIYHNIETLKQSAPRAVTLIIGDYMEKFSSFSSRIIQEKTHDLKDLRDSLLRLLGEKVTLLEPDFQEEQMIVVANELTPQETARFDHSKIVGFATETGSEISHIAILARALKLPAVVGVSGIVDAVKPGDRLLIDGNNGFVYINPDTKIKKEYLHKSTTVQDHITSIRQTLSQPTTSAKAIHKKISLTANIGLPFEIDQAIQEGITSVGLLRTEFFYMRQQSWPDEELQTQFYERLLISFSHGTVTVRLLDIGGDKFLSYMPELQEDNSYFGFRSIRLLLDHPEILKSQLEAIHLSAEKTGCTPRILIPMVTHAWEVEAVRETLLEISNGKKYPIGIMIEIPAALFQIKELADKADFISIGTNDLAQYLLAVDRNNLRVKQLYSPLHPALMRALDYIFQSVNSLSKDFSVCGEMAGSPLSALALLAIGYRSLSLSPSRGLKIQYLIRHLPQKILPKVRETILSTDNPKESEKLLRMTIRKYAPLLTS